MSFSAQWLSLREPYDRAARNRTLLAAVARAFADRGALGVVDLACGAGATLRAVSPYLSARQDWRLVDNDLSLLAQAGREAPPSAKVTTMAVDLVRDLELALDGPLHLVTTSALLDLVSAQWLERLAVEAAARRLPVYAALSYDGRAALNPADERDSTVIAAVNRHQKTNKGFGAALGPDAAAAAIERFADLGYSIVQGRSDWVFGPDDREIQNEVASGWAEAASALKTPPRIDIAGWLADRKSLIASGASTMRVGHIDFFAHPTIR